MTDPQNIRTDYFGQPLLEADAASDPFEQFDRWFDAAVAVDPEMANTMTLATVSPAGEPDARVVLLKAVEQRGFVFYTNHASQKGQDLSHTPHAALCFWWPALLRQVRIKGTTTPLDRAAAEAYFATRPRNSQLGALASQQSQVLRDRQTLEARFEQLEAEYDQKPVPMPATWGGYRLKPVAFEFWQGRLSRLHDRLRYTPAADGWQIERLAP